MQVGFILSRYDVKYKQPGSYLDNGLGGVFDNQSLQNGPFLQSQWDASQEVNCPLDRFAI